MRSGIKYVHHVSGVCNSGSKYGSIYVRVLCSFLERAKRSDTALVILEAIEMHVTSKEVLLGL